MMSKKMALVPPELVSEYYQITKPENRLEDGIMTLIQKNEMSDDFKAKLLSQLIPEYQRVMRPKKPFEFPIETNVPSIASDDAKLYPDIPEVLSINKYLHYAVPKTRKKFVIPILESLKKSNYTFNEQNELEVNGKPEYRSNVVDLFSYVMRDLKKKEPPPKGFDAFFKALVRSNIPARWIGNKSVVERLALSHTDPAVKEESSNSSATETLHRETLAPFRKKIKWVPWSSE